MQQVTPNIRVFETSKAQSGAVLRRMLSKRLMPLYTRYQMASVPQSLQADEEIVLSHEGLASLACEFLKQEKIWLIFHNFPAGFDDEDRFGTRVALKPFLRSSDRWLLRRPNIYPVFLSRRELQLAESMGPVRPPRLIQPGMPPVNLNCPLVQADKVDLVISGTYDWSVKRRDADWLKAEVLSKLDHQSIGYLYADASFRGVLPHWRDTRELPADGQLRVGVVPDRFLNGMKLKVLWYIAHNCVVASPRFLGDEFYGIPHADEFIRGFQDAATLGEVIREAGQANLEAYRIFQNSCFSHFSWDRQVKEGFDVQAR
ncbi:hypothetical protein [Planctomicrobium sp. SH664]|uniref:hypothetical protein n=1 Tax=Planctomicrobium sp. SH664 TaxID=3448125 RepID=UPI003F5ADF90